jgi:putative ABC transport system permease protein
MVLRDFVIGWRLLLKEPAYSMVVMFGLSVGIAVCFLLMGFVQHSLRYDQHVPDAESVFLTNVQFNYKSSGVPWMEESPLALAGAAEHSGFGVLASGYAEQSSSVLVNNVPHKLILNIVGPAFQQIFDLKPLVGDLDIALTRPDAIALTLETAQNLFGREDVLGQKVQINGRFFQVAAILPDPPTTTTLPFKALIGYDSGVLDYNRRNNLLHRWSQLGGKVYLKLPAGLSPERMTRILQDAVDQSPLNTTFPATLLAELGSRKLMEVRLCALPDAYFQSDIQISRNPQLHGDRRAIFGLAGISALILFLAVTNYVNLTTIRTLRRQREVAMRKVLGASIGRVIGQFLAESVLVALLASGIGIAIAWLARTPFSYLMDRTLDGLFSVTNLLVCLLLGVIVGLLAGGYPTWVALKVRVVQALSGRGNTETASGQWMRRLLTVLQFSTAMGLTAVCIAVAWQTDYASKLSPGFDTDGLLQIDLAATKVSDRPGNLAFREALLRIPGVLGVAGGLEAVGRHVNDSITNLSRPGESAITVNVKEVSPEFFEVYGINPVAGRVYNSRIDGSNNDVMVVDAAAARAFGFASAESAVGAFLADPDGGATFRIIGIAGAVRHTSIHQVAEPVVYTIGPDLRVLTVRFTGEVEPIERAVQSLWQRHFPDQVLRMNTAQSFFDLEYADDLRIAQMLGASTLISMSIAAFGIYVLAAYSVERRKREIVLRKLYGAPRKAIAMIIGREFFILVSISGLIGLTIAAMVTERYLAGFIDRAPIGPWALSGAFLMACLVALISTLRHTVSAITIKPVVVLREG